jgi:lipoprotein-anchoring transpeptidase ErfK/SrfK
VARGRDSVFVGAVGRRVRAGVAAAALAALLAPLGAAAQTPGAGDGAAATAPAASTAVATAPYWAAQAALAYPGPGRQQAGDKEIVVSLGQQRLWAYEGAQPVLSTLVSTGTAETPEVATPLGQYRISVKFLQETMEGTVSGEDYRVEDVPWVMYFTDEGHAVHGTYWHQNFGVPMSHGCVNLPLDVAEWIYGWTPEGTAITIVP